MEASALTIGSELELAASGRRCTVERFIGEGTQGSVYEVNVSDGARLALKWYHPQTATETQRRAIELLVDRGRPDHRFLWPEEVVVCDGLPGWGYLMPLRPPEFPSLGEILAGKATAGYALVATAGRELADTFLSLHSQGLCYRDINFSNVSFDPTTGVPLILDTDNVGIDGQSPSAVLGSRRFMAPEIVRGEAGPSIATDLYSLAVLLFYLLMVGHPLVGRRELDFPCWDDRAESLLFGQQPLFVLDPADDANAPVPGLHDPVLQNWPLYPAYVQKLFIQTFTSGLNDPSSRVRESVWRSALSKLRDAVSQCAHCGKEVLFDADAPPRPCWFCDQVSEPPLRLDFGRASVVLTETTLLYPHHLAGSYKFDEPIASVTRHPKRPDRWGLRNVGERAWTATMPSGEAKVIEPGGAVALVIGMVADFGEARAKLVR